MLPYIADRSNALNLHGCLVLDDETPANHHSELADEGTVTPTPISWLTDENLFEDKTCLIIGSYGVRLCDNGKTDEELAQITRTIPENFTEVELKLDCRQYSKEKGESDPEIKRTILILENLPTHIRKVTLNGLALGKADEFPGVSELATFVSVMKAVPRHTEHLVFDDSSITAFTEQEDDWSKFENIMAQLPSDLKGLSFYNCNWTEALAMDTQEHRQYIATRLLQNIPCFKNIQTLEFLGCDIHVNRMEFIARLLGAMPHLHTFSMAHSNLGIKSDNVAESMASIKQLAGVVAGSSIQSFDFTKAFEVKGLSLPSLTQVANDSQELSPIQSTIQSFLTALSARLVEIPGLKATLDSEIVKAKEDEEPEALAFKERFRKKVARWGQLRQLTFSGVLSHRFIDEVLWPQVKTQFKDALHQVLSQLPRQVNTVRLTDTAFNSKRRASERWQADEVAVLLPESVKTVGFGEARAFKTPVGMIEAVSELLNDGRLGCASGKSMSEIMHEFDCLLPSEADLMTLGLRSNFEYMAWLSDNTTGKNLTALELINAALLLRFLETLFGSSSPQEGPNETEQDTPAASSAAHSSALSQGSTHSFGSATTVPYVKQSAMLSQDDDDELALAIDKAVLETFVQVLTSMLYRHRDEMIAGVLARDLSHCLSFAFLNNENKSESEIEDNSQRSIADSDSDLQQFMKQTLSGLKQLHNRVSLGTAKDSQKPCESKGSSPPSSDAAQKRKHHEVVPHPVELPFMVLDAAQCISALKKIPEQLLPDVSGADPDARCTPEGQHTPQPDAPPPLPKRVKRTRSRM